MLTIYIGALKLELPHQQIHQFYEGTDPTQFTDLNSRTLNLAPAQLQENLIYLLNQIKDSGKVSMALQRNNGYVLNEKVKEAILPTESLTLGDHITLFITSRQEAIPLVSSAKSIEDNGVFVSPHNESPMALAQGTYTLLFEGVSWVLHRNTFKHPDQNKYRTLFTSTANFVAPKSGEVEIHLSSATETKVYSTTLLAGQSIPVFIGADTADFGGYESVSGDRPIVQVIW